MEINVIQNDGEPIVIQAKGEITVKSYRAITDTVDQVAALDPPPEKVILDMSLVNYVDSVGLGAFLKMFHTLKKKGASFIMKDVNEDIRESLAMTRLDQLLNLE